MSPEVLLSEEYGLPSDLFSLGMIFVEMLTGKEPSSTFPERPPQVKLSNAREMGFAVFGSRLWKQGNTLEDPANVLWHVLL